MGTENKTAGSRHFVSSLDCFLLLCHHVVVFLGVLFGFEDFEATNCRLQRM